MSPVGMPPAFFEQVWSTSWEVQWAPQQNTPKRSIAPQGVLQTSSKNAGGIPTGDMKLLWFIGQVCCMYWGWNDLFFAFLGWISSSAKQGAKKQKNHCSLRECFKPAQKMLGASSQVTWSFCDLLNRFAACTEAAIDLPFTFLGWISALRTIKSGYLASFWKKVPKQSISWCALDFLAEKKKKKKRKKATGCHLPLTPWLENTRSPLPH